MGYEGAKLTSLCSSAPSQKAARRMAHVGRDEFHRRVVQETPIDDSPFPSRTPGTARRSWNKRPVGPPLRAPREDIYETGIVSHDEVTSYLEYGTGLYGPYRRAYVIRPKDPNGVLSFYSRKSGGWVLASSVLHPGIHPQRPLATGAALTEHVLPEIMRPILSAWVQEMELRARTAGKVRA